jgi:NifB/MoaA-like Fe-S oxidoreductase
MRKDVKMSDASPLSATVMTGTLFAPVLKKLLDELNAQFGTKLEVVAVENRYFGGDVSVAGLLTGSDYLAARASVRGDFVIIPTASVKSDEKIMLDGMSFAELEAGMGVPVHAMDFASFEEMLDEHTA